MRINLYAQNRHVVIIDGVPIVDFMEGDFMEVELHGNAAQRTEGADGPAMNISTAQGATITINLKPTSPSLGVLYKLREAQQEAPYMFSIQLVTGTQEIISASGCAFAKLDAFSSGDAKMKDRKFKFECLECPMDLSEVLSLIGNIGV